MFITPPIGLIKRKGPAGITLIDAQFSQNLGGTNSVIVGFAAATAGDIIVATGAHSGTLGPLPTLSGYNPIFTTSFSGFSQNDFTSGYLVALGGETSVTIGFPGGGPLGDPKFGLAMVWRGAATEVTNQTGFNSSSGSPRGLGNHTESDNTSMSILIGWLNRNGANDANITADPSGYTVAAQADGAALGGTTQDRIFTAWYRKYDNRGAQNPTYAINPTDQHDTIFANIALAI